MAALHPSILKLLGKTYAPSSLVNLHYRQLDLSFKTDGAGRPMLLFIGKRAANGLIHGERYARRVVADREGNIIKDHWDLKGNAS